MITIYDIAKKVGCSSATVSKALNDYTDVNQKTKDRILAAAKEMGYTPNSQAQALTKKKTWNIGVLFEVDSEERGGLTHYYFAQIIESFKKYANELGYDITFVSERLGNDHISFSQHARRRHCDGVIIANYNYENEDIKELVQSNIPVVVIDYNFDNVSSIFSENYEGLKLLTQYLIDMGHKDIIYLHGQHLFVTDKRIRGFKDTMRKNALPIKDTSLVEGMYYNRHLIEEKTKEIVKKNKPSAIIFSDDYAAVWGAKAIHQMGLKVPEDISIAGFDGLEIGEMMTPRLTTIRQDTTMIGQQAAKRLMDIIETKNHSKVDVRVGVELVKGESVKNINRK